MKQLKNNNDIIKKDSLIKKLETPNFENLIDPL